MVIVVMQRSQPPNAPTLKQLLKEKGITKVSLRESVGVSETTLRDWQRGARMPRIDLAIAVAAKLGVSLKTFCRSIGLDVEAVPDDVAPPVDPELQTLVDGVVRAMEAVESYKTSKP